MPSRCTFQFDHSNAVYFSGEVINGRIILNTTSKKSCRGVFIKFKGTAKVHWTEKVSRTTDGNTESQTEHYTGEQTYIHMKSPVHGMGTLPRGQHIYTFSIPLPMECPSSYVGKYAEVRYELSLEIDRPFRFNNNFNQQLIVLRQLNLNYYPDFQLPLQARNTKKLGVFPFASGPVISTLTIPLRGYAPGQTISYDLDIDNQSSKNDLNGIELEFQQIYKFSVTSPGHKSRYHTVSLIKAQQREKVLRLSKRLLKGNFIVPQVPPTSANDCLIGVSYGILINIKTGILHRDCTIKVPIIIGTVPIAQRKYVSMTSNIPDNSPPSYDAITRGK